MSEIKIETDYANNSEIVCINESNLQSSLDYITKNNSSVIALDPTSGELENFDFLKTLQIQTLSVRDECIDLLNFPVLTQVNEVIINFSSAKIDFSKFPNLERLFIYWGLELIGVSETLKSLRIFNYSKKLNKTEVANFAPKVEFLEINKLDIDNLLGFENLMNLKKIDLFYANKLRDLSSLCKLPELKSLKLNNVKKIESYDFLESLINLQEIYLESCKEINNVQFIKKIKGLKIIVLNNTNVLDGILDYCKEIPYAWVNPNKKHYTLKDKDLNKNNEVWLGKLKI